MASSKGQATIGKSLDQQVSLQRQAFIGALRCTYWLAKEEIPHAKHASLIDLMKEMGCSYMSHLSQVGK